MRLMSTTTEVTPAASDEPDRESVGRAQAKLTADYQDHTLWATVEVTRGTERQRWLGVLGMWLRMSSTTDR